MAAAMERAQLYFAAHPGSPSAVRRPELSLRSGTWVAILGRDIENGIVGFGMTVEAALDAFDAQYRGALRPPPPSIERETGRDKEFRRRMGLRADLSHGKS